MIAAAETRSSLWRPLGVPGFRLLLTSEAFGAAGTGAAALALAWGTLQVTGSGLLLGSVLLVQALPAAALTLFGGAVADRLPARFVLGSTAAMRAAAAALVGGFAAAGHLELWMLFAAAAMFGTAAAFMYPAGAALLPALLGEDLEAGNSLLQMTGMIITIAAPALAGVAIAAGGTELAFLAAAVCFAAGAAAGYLLPSARKLGPISQPLLHFIAAGLRFVARDGALRSVLLVVGLISFWVNAPFEVGVTLLARHRLGGALSLGAIDASFAAATLLGTLLVGVLGRTRRVGLLVIGVGSLIGVVMILFGQVRNLAEAIPLALAAGVAAGYGSVVASAWIQRRAPQDMVGRVMSVAVLANQGLAPLSFALSGALAQLHVELLFGIAGSAVLAGTALAALSRSIRQA